MLLIDAWTIILVDEIFSNLVDVSRYWSIRSIWSALSLIQTYISVLEHPEAYI